ncbi:hypothetical protein MHEI_29910 [Mycobacterium heidelbergense]|nr:hypothetical protein MHEI_29910 [Mycobacterium heidelbergense]
MGFDTVGDLEPIIDGFDVNTADQNPPLTQSPGEMPPDKAATPGDQSCFSGYLHPQGPFQGCAVT